MDGFKLNISHVDEETLFNSPDFEIRGGFNNSTSEITYPYRVNFYGLRLKINPTRITLEGSFHKFYNSYFNREEHNYNDFSLEQFKEVANVLMQTFHFDPKRTVIENLEFGVNIRFSINVRAFLKDNVICNKFRTPTRKENYENGYYLQFRTKKNSSKIEKIYDKGDQNGLGHNLLRIERKFLRNDLLSPFGIKYLNDLLDPIKLDKLGNDLVSSINNYIIVDILDPLVSFSKKEKNIFKEGINPKWWERLMNEKWTSTRKRKKGKV